MIFFYRVTIFLEITQKTTYVLDAGPNPSMEAVEALLKAPAEVGAFLFIATG
ncbi:MAG: hypothetical protein ACE5IR_28925 [bacterium]